MATGAGEGEELCFLLLLEGDALAAGVAPAAVLDFLWCLLEPLAVGLGFAAGAPIAPGDAIAAPPAVGGADGT